MPCLISSSNFIGSNDFPESLVRVQEMTGKPVTFYKANLCDPDSIRVPFQKVILWIHKRLCKCTFLYLISVNVLCNQGDNIDILFLL